MNFLKSTSLAIFLLFLSLFTCYVVKAQVVDAKDYPLLNSLNEINKNTRDTCQVIVFVNSVYVCEPCPRGADCKPCIGNHIMVADSLNGKKQFRVFVKDPGRFLASQKYKLLIRLFKYNSEQEVYESKLIEEE